MRNQSQKKIFFVAEKTSLKISPQGRKKSFDIRTLTVIGIGIIFTCLLFGI